MSEFDPESEDFAFRKPALEEVTQALLQEAESSSEIIPSVVVYGLSDLTLEERQAVEAVWGELPSVCKHQVLRALNNASESMFELNFREIAFLALADESSEVRTRAVELLWTDESAETMRQLINLAEFDSVNGVRASALESLGRFILLGEYGDMPAELTLKAQELTLKLHKDKSEARDVRRRALEALANSSHPEASKLIRAAYEHGNHELKVGAIFAMGNTCNRMWAKMLLEELVSRDSECVFEAVRACGQIQLRDSVQRVGELTLSDDQNIQEIAIWSLGEIGGKQAFERLNSLAENVEDDSAAAVIDEALDAASFSLTFASLDLDLEDD